jgi:CRP/FNR family transcriptional regulator, polysaccharide utilization system transcription regulator
MNMVEGTLRHIPMFRVLPQDELKRIVRTGTMQTFGRGEVVFSEGEPAEALYVVVRGCVHIVKRTPQGGAVTVVTLTMHEGLCGVSSLDHSAYTAGAIAATATEVIAIPTSMMHDLLEAHPAFAREVLYICCARIRQISETLSLAQGPVQQRVAASLLRLRSVFGDVVPVTHHELSQMSGTRLETSIRTMAEWKRLGYVHTARGKITIAHPEYLQAILHITHTSNSE